MTAALAVQSPGVQQRLVNALIAKVNENVDGRISFSKLDIQAPGAFVVKDFLVMDDKPYTEDIFGTGYSPVDTILYVREAYGTISPRALFTSRSVQLNRASARGVRLNTVIEPGTDNFQRFLSAFKKEKKDSSDVAVNISRVLVEDMHYRLVNFTETGLEKLDHCVNYSDMELYAQSIDGYGLRVKNGIVSANINDAQLSEKTGATLRLTGGRFKVGNGGQTDIYDVVMEDGYSRLEIKQYSMHGTESDDLKDYTHQVLMKAKLRRSLVASQTVTAFSGLLYGMDFALETDELEMEGFVDDFKVKKLKFTEVRQGIKGDMDFAVTGITITPNLMIDAKVNNLSFTTGKLSKFIAGAIPGSDINLSRFAPGTNFVLKGTAKGALDNLRTNARLESKLGKVYANLGVRNLLSKDKSTDISGSVRTDRLGVGKIIGKDFLGDCTAATGFDAKLHKGNVEVKVDSLIVDKLGVLGYDYTGIAAAGLYSDKAFDGKIISTDPNLNFIFQGIFNLSPRTNNAIYKFSANIGYADLQALNIDRRGGTSKVSGQLSSNFLKTPGGDLLGDISLTGLTLEDDSGIKDIGDIYVGSHSNGGRNRAQIESRFLDAGYVGTRSLSDILKDIQTVTTRRELPSLYSRKDRDTGDPNAEYDISVNFHDSRDLLSFIKPGAYIADSTRMELIMNGSGKLTVSVKSPRLAYRTNYLKGLDISIDNLGGSANLALLTEEFKLNNLGFCNTALTAFAQSDEFFTSFHYDNIVGIDNMGELYLSGSLERDATDTLIVRAKPLSSYVRFENSQWDMAESDMVLRAGDIALSHFLLTNADQIISIDGGISRNNTDTLSVKMDNLDLGIVNYFLSKDMDIRGKASGKALLASPLNGSRDAFINLGCDSLKVNGEDAGTVKLAAVWDGASDKISTYVRNIVDGYDALNAKASYRPGSKEVSANIKFDNMNTVVIAPFTSAFLSGISGGISGTITAEGRTDSLYVSSDSTRIDNVRVRIGYTNVPYTLNGPFSIDGDVLHLDNITIADDEGGIGMLGGSLAFGPENRFGMDMQVRVSDLMVMNTYGDGGNVHGNLYASGDASVSGSPDDLLISADVSTAKSGNLHISAVGATATRNGKLLTFTDHSEYYVDPYELMLNEFFEARERSGKEGRRSNLELHAIIGVTPEVEAVLELDSSGDNFINARGTGQIMFDYTSSGSPNVAGDYNITNGRYHFAIPGLISKNFNFESGSSIKFGGNLFDTELDLNATYSLRTNINPLLSSVEDASVATRRLVNCDINISDKISSPKLSFGIDIPDLDATAKSEVESALSTEDKMQKQFLSLVVAGAFLQDEQSGIVNNSSVVISNMSELVSRQFSNLLARMDIPIDLGVGYQQNSTGTDLYDVRVSTELFDNRVEVYGSVGNRVNGNSVNPNGDMVGDIDIDIKLDKPGQLRLNLFSHSADEYTSYLDYSQRNGVGITYQKEFHRWRDFWRGLFRKNSRKSFEDLNRTVVEDEKQVIKIEADE